MEDYSVAFSLFEHPEFHFPPQHIPCSYSIQKLAQYISHIRATFPSAVSNMLVLMRRGRPEESRRPNFHGFQIQIMTKRQNFTAN